MRAGVQVWFYKDGTRFTFGTLADNVVGFVRAEMNAEFRRQIATWTREAMTRKARAGHVTGGRVFGYENVRVEGHVERRIVEAEAAVVRRIFELSASGLGTRQIAHRLNAEDAPSPKPRRAGRLQAWDPATIYAMLTRLLYRGELVWNRTRKRNAWGEHEQRPRPEAEWVRVSAPSLRIVPEPLWTAVQRRLESMRRFYLRSTNGQLYGRAKGANGHESRYLLPGLAACGVCGGGLIVHSRVWGGGRQHAYVCGSYHRKGTTVCDNRRVLPISETNAAVLQTIEATRLSSAAIRSHR